MLDPQNHHAVRAYTIADEVGGYGHKNAAGPLGAPGVREIA
jgi:hypothetical protein